jgi:hypothetical protein
MTATLNFLSRITNEVFQSQMQRAARKICERQHYFGGHTPSETVRWTCGSKHRFGFC